MGDLFVVHCMSVPSLRRFVAYGLKTLAGVYRRNRYILWGYTRSPAELNRMAASVGFAIRDPFFYHRTARDPNGNAKVISRGDLFRDLPTWTSDGVVTVFSREA